MTRRPPCDAAAWEATPIPPGLNPCEIHLWRLPPQADSAAIKLYLPVLTQEEKQRADRFRFRIDRDQFIQTHASLRLLLGQYLACPHRQMDIIQNRFGKPSLRGHQLAFSLSHTANVSVIAITPSAAVGVDVEQIRASRDLLELAESNFSPGEYRKLLTLEGEAQALAFYRCWTRKEALLKADGSGLSRQLDSFEVSLLEHEESAVLSCNWGQPEGTRWKLFDFDPGIAAAGAVAISAALSTDWQVRTFDWTAMNMAELSR